MAVIAGMMRPTLDQVHIKVIMNKEDMDNFVMCVATKKTAQHFSKEMADLVSIFLKFLVSINLCNFFFFIECLLP